MAATVAYPLVWVLQISVTSSATAVTGGHFVGLENYGAVLRSGSFRDALWHTVVFVVLTVTIEVVLSVLLATVLAKRLAGHRIFVGIFALPLMMAPIVSGFMWRWLFADQYGLVNYLLSLVGVDGPLWGGSPFWARLSILVANLWTALPFGILVLFAGMAGIPEELDEAAQLDGAGPWQRFRHVTLPLLRPAILLVLVVRIADAFRVYDVVYILTGGGPAGSTNVLNTYIFKRSFSDFQFGQGAAAAVLVMVLSAVISVAAFRVLRPKEDAQ